MKRSTIRLVCIGLLLTIVSRCDSRNPVEPSPTSTAGSIRGTVFFAGSPVAGADVYLTGPGTNRALVSGTDGAFVFSGLSPTIYTIGASFHGMGCSSTTADLKGGVTVTTSIDCESWAAPLGTSLAGTIAADGMPLGGARVFLTGVSFTEALTERSVNADDDGRFMFSALTQGTYIVTAQAQGFTCLSRIASLSWDVPILLDISCASEGEGAPPPLPTTGPMGKIAFERSGRIMILELAGMFLSRFIEGRAPSWSADGQKLAFQRPRCPDHSLPPYYDCDDIWLVNADGGELSPLTDYEWVMDQDPAWSPDGSKVAYFRWVHGLDMSYIVISDVEPPSALWAETVVSSWWPLSRPTWSPDGARIAFECEGPPPYWQSDICIGSSAVNLGWSVTAIGRLSNALKVTSGTWKDSEPAWSPDGQWIAFTTDRPGDGRTWIALVRPDGSGLTTLVPGRRPAWSPDGSRLVFVGSREEPGLWLMNADGSGLTRITVDPADDTPSWGS